MEITDTDASPSFTNRILNGIIKCEEVLVSLLLTAMILLACYQIGLRWFTSGGLPWIDPLLRYLVLWSGLLGAVLATAKDNHIALDAIGYLLQRKLKLWVHLLTDGFCVIVSVFLFRATLLFLSSEIEYGGSSLFGLDSWLWFLIFPIAFGMILLHFSIDAVTTVWSLLQGPQPDKQ
ncbi:MAG: TRAP transporter small permease [Desulfofustis sp.]|nr:TRAP transporter small permease [Desulfofustis sp.]